MKPAALFRFAFLPMIALFSILETTSVCAAAAPFSSSRLSNLLYKSASQKRMVETAADHSWSLLFNRRPGVDTLNVVAIRVEFAPDTSTLTTGNGTFGIRGDDREFAYYNNDTTYRYDRLPHDLSYFDYQFQYAQNYYRKVSRNALELTYQIYPTASSAAYKVAFPMTHYSPAAKKPSESYDEYYIRRTIGHVEFIRDALRAAANNTSLGSPFVNLRDSAGILIDQSGRKTAICIIHAGASFLTDGGEQSYLGRNTPSDLIDFFATPDLFSYLGDTLALDTAKGKRSVIRVSGQNGSALSLSEIMMVSETSNQDGLNWGIHGILINQIARQLGIPDLFSTMSGISGIGAFCIMDFYGYSAGRGFVPPYPSAWVRAFMGWDTPRIVPIGSTQSYRVRAISDSGLTPLDTTILMVPINDHEYYLIENRQRNLSSNPAVFKYDSSNGTRYIDPYDQLNLVNCVTATSGTTGSRSILDVRNYDVSLPASGVLVWHVDDRIIRERLNFNMVNADSLYRGVSLEEADGVVDLGVTFSDVFYNAVYDYGGAEDVFPHYRMGKDTVFVNSMGPFTDPSTHSNDGGQSFVSLTIAPHTPLSTVRKEIAALITRNYVVHNYVDTFFTVTPRWDFSVAGWPKRTVPRDTLCELVAAELVATSPGSEVVAVSKLGRVYVWPTDSTAAVNSFVNQSRFAAVSVQTLFGDTAVYSNGNNVSDTFRFLDTIAHPVFGPSATGSAVYIPCSNNTIRVLTSVNVAASSATATWTTIALAAQPSTYVTILPGGKACVGLQNGTVAIFDTNGTAVSDSIRLSSPTAAPVTALTALSGSKFAAIQNDGTLSICDATTHMCDTTTTVPNGIGPFSLVSGDITPSDSGKREIVVSDSRHGVWLFGHALTLCAGWTQEPNDWATVYANIDSTQRLNRTALPVNTASPALADLDNDGCLDIVISGTNGLYALNYKGVLIERWPAYFDTRIWYNRGSLLTAPVVASSSTGDPLVVFATQTGENQTFTTGKVTSSDRSKGTIRYTTADGTIDSLWGLTSGYIDSLLVLSDSIILPYTAPGGFIDAVDKSGKRPRFRGTTFDLQSYWPMTLGSAAVTAPCIYSPGTGTTNRYMSAASVAGWVFTWQLPRTILGDSIFWAMPGATMTRTFAYNGGASGSSAILVQPIRMYSYPNPTAKSDRAIFRYLFNAPARNVRLDIYSYSGYHVYQKNLGDFINNYKGWNEEQVMLATLGQAVYRCRMEATIAGVKQVVYWKMAVTK